MPRRPRVKIDVGSILRRDREAARARDFANEEGEGDFIPWTYDPSKTTWPQNGWDHRRTTMAGYNKNTQTLRIKFYTDGAVYDYYNVDAATARAFRRAASPGRFINARLNSLPYERIN